MTDKSSLALNTARPVYVVGAGFSAGLGYPLTSDLLMRLWARLNPSIKNQLRKVVEFHHPGFNPDRFSSFPNVEQLLSEMLVNEELFDSSRQYEGKFTKSDLRELQRDVLLEIADWFHDLSAEVSPGESRVKWLRQFGKQIRHEGATIISFNWDLILDELLFGDDINPASYGFGTLRRGNPVLLKPHGSLNWFEETQGRFLKDEKRFEILAAKMGTVYAFNKFRAPISKTDRRYAPLIVPPVYLKNFQKPVFSHLWNSCTSALSRASKIIFLGYSLPSADLHAQFIFRCGFHNQIEGELDRNGGRRKPTGAGDVIIVNPDRGAAQRIESVAGPKHQCQWVSTPIADWILSKDRGN